MVAQAAAGSLLECAESQGLAWGRCVVTDELGQVGLALGGEEFTSDGERRVEGPRRLPAGRRPLPVIRATSEEMARHQAKLAMLDKAAGGQSLWRALDPLPEM